jgi:hypothetical protein
MLPIIKRFFFLQRIYFTQTLVSILIMYGLTLAVLSLVMPEAESRFASPLWYWIWPVYGYFLVRTCLRLALVSRRIKKRHYVEIPLSAPMPSEIASSAPSYELQDADKTKLIEQGENWELYDATFNFYRRTKSGQYLSKQAYYTVFEIRLKRKVPHIIFDSKTAKRSQFRYMYLQSQRISLEGNFDTYFDTYAPQTYNIDFLSFITPEVMLALVEAHDFDIELIGDRLMLYGPLLSEADMPAIKAVGEKIANHLNDNLDNYRDDRLQGASRQEDVAPFAKKLLKSPMKFLPLLILSGIGSGVILYLALTYSMRILVEQISLIIFITFVSTAWSVIKLSLENHRFEQEYRDFLAAHEPLPSKNDLA